jgi:hypothetical protein
MIVLILLIAVAFVVIVRLTGIQWMYLCRVSIFGGLFLGLIAVLAVTAERSLLLGAYDLRDNLGSAAFGFCLFLAIWAVCATSNLVLEAGKLRVRQRITVNVARVKWLRLAFVITIAVLNWNALRYASEGNRFAVGISFWAGFLAGLLAYYLEKRIKLPWGRKNDQLGPRVAVRDAEIRLAGQTYNVPRWLSRGYLSPSGQGLNLSKVHVKAIVAAAFILALYLAAWLFRLATPCYLALAVAVLIWLLGAVAFFFDAYRIPIVFPLVIWVWIVSGHPKTDHFFPLKVDSKKIGPTDPGELLARARSDGNPIVLVAAAGGGIQASAWTVKVLSGLEKKLDDLEPGIFAQSVRLLSGVSGGSTGVMYYVHSAYPFTDAPTEEKRLDAALKAAESSSLESAVQGLAYTDLHRFFVPFFIQDKFHDRAQALERAWIENGDDAFASMNISPLSRATLKGWREELNKGEKPAVIFNSTVVETGQRFSFSTSEFDSQKHQIAQGQDDFDLRYRNSDIDIVTAVRLSATFPFVSPAACAAYSTQQLQLGNIGDNKLHFVDGGYFDNSGLVALSTWLDSGLQDLVANRPSEVPTEILVIQILPFPNPKPGDGPAHGSHFIQVFSPLQTVLNVRNEVQAGFSQRDFSFLTKRWELEAEHPVKITFVTISFPEMQPVEDPPLSWHLRNRNIRQISHAWSKIDNGDDVNKVLNFFRDRLAKQEESRNRN